MAVLDLDSKSPSMVGGAGRGEGRGRWTGDHAAAWARARRSARGPTTASRERPPSGGQLLEDWRRQWQTSMAVEGEGRIHVKGGGCKRGQRLGGQVCGGEIIG